MPIPFYFCLNKTSGKLDPVISATKIKDTFKFGSKKNNSTNNPINMNVPERDVGLIVKHTKITHSVPTTLPSGVVSLPHVSASDGFVRGNGTPNAIAAGVANVDKSKNKCELYNTKLYGES